LRIPKLRQFAAKLRTRTRLDEPHRKLFRVSFDCFVDFSVFYPSPLIKIVGVDYCRPELICNSISAVLCSAARAFSAQPTDELEIIYYRMDCARQILAENRFFFNAHI
jgi:hypothetical protein